jgi:hypothetical protein
LPQADFRTHPDAGAGAAAPAAAAETPAAGSPAPAMGDHSANMMQILIANDAADEKCPMMQQNEEHACRAGMHARRRRDAGTTAMPSMPMAG